MAELNADLMLRVEPLRRSLQRTADGVARLEEQFPNPEAVLAQLPTSAILAELRFRAAASWRGARDFLRRAPRHPAASLARTDSQPQRGARNASRTVTDVLDLERCPITGEQHAWVDAGDPARPLRDVCPDCKATRDPVFGHAHVPEPEPEPDRLDPAAEVRCGVCGDWWDHEHEHDPEGCPLLPRSTRGSRLADRMAALTRTILGGPGPLERAEQVRRAHEELFRGRGGVCACSVPVGTRAGRCARCSRPLPPERDA